MIVHLVRLWAVILKEIRQTMRDRRMVALLVAAPAVQLVVFGSAVQLEVDRVPTAVIDHDVTQGSREHVRRLLADGTLVAAPLARDESSALHMLESSAAAAVLVVPAGFSRDLARRRDARVQVVLDGSDPNRARVVASAVEGYVRQLSPVRRTNALPSPVRSRVLFNPTLATSVYMVPGVSAILLLLVTTVIAAMGIAREREQGTFEQVQVAPVDASLLVLGKIIPFAAVGLFDFLLALVVGSYGFDVPVRGSLLLLFGATLLYLLNTLGIGVLIATLSTSQQQAFMGGFLFMLPAALLSGIMTPVSSMPSWLSPWTFANPLRHYAEILRAVLLRGATAADVGVQLLALLVMGCALCMLAARRFRDLRG